MKATQQPLMRAKRLLGGLYQQYDSRDEVKQSRTREKRSWRRDWEQENWPPLLVGDDDQS